MSRFLKIGNSHNEIIEVGGPKSRKPIIITRPDKDGMDMAERICLAVNLTSYLSLEELRRATTQVISGTRRLERLVLWIEN